MGKDKIPRPYETRYWIDARKTKPVTKGFPKHEDGSIEGAGRAVARGFASKVQCIERETGRVLWTVKRAPRVPGVHIRGLEVHRGDPDERPSRKKE